MLLERKAARRKAYCRRAKENSDTPVNPELADGSEPFVYSAIARLLGKSARRRITARSWVSSPNGARADPGAYPSRTGGRPLPRACRGSKASDDRQQGSGRQKAVGNRDAATRGGAHLRRVGAHVVPVGTGLLLKEKKLFVPSRESSSVVALNAWARARRDDPPASRMHILIFVCNFCRQAFASGQYCIRYNTTKHFDFRYADGNRL